MGSKSVVVIVDASKEVNSRVFHWAINGLSLKQGDKLTLFPVLHQLYTPMGYISKLGESNERVVEIEFARREEEFQHNEHLLHISKLYESEKVEFRIELVIGSLTEIALNKAKELNATWVILDRQMKKDEENIVQKLSCGISRLKRNNKIEHLRGPPVLPTEIYCISHETLDESLPEEVESVEAYPESSIKVDELQPSDEQGKIQSNPDKEDDSTAQIIADELGVTQNLTSHTELDELTVNDNPTSQTKPDELRMVQEEGDSEQLIDQTKDELLIQDQEDVRDGKQEKIIFGNSKCSICSVCKSRRPSNGWEKDFTFREIEVATDGFSANNSLSEAPHGPFFRGQLECELKIAVKKHQLTDSQAQKHMMSQLQLVLKARHKNVAMLLGSSTQQSQLLTVYEYACNASLDKYLSKESCRPLSWGERVKIAVGVSCGLKYLHDNNIIHGNIKPTTILLNHDFEPMIGDFSFGKTKREVKSHKDRKSSGYTAPEYMETGKLSTKTDVYSFGVVLLELITGKRATDKISGEKSLVSWAKRFLEGKKYPQLVDPKIGSSYEDEELQWLVQATGQCLRKNPKDRFSMNMVVSTLQGIITYSTEDCVIEDCSPAKSTCSMTDTTFSKGETKLDQLNKEEKAGHLSRNGKQILSRPRAVEKSSDQMISNNSMMGLTKVDELSENEEQIHSIPHGEQESSREKISSFIKKETPVSQMTGDTLNGHGGEVILDGSRSFLCSICKSRRPKIGCQKDFTYNELEAATDGFSIDNSVSEGGNGPAFSGLLKSKLKIFVKIHQITSTEEEKMFKSEFQLLTKAMHKNVVMLLGSCAHKKQQIIVFECACNGSLDQYLSGGSSRLSWRERVKVAIGVSRGLKYLHEMNIVHGSIKPSNILLNHEFEPLLGDFGFGLKKSRKDKNVGNSEYSAPEYMENGKLSTKADVYSFGVVLLELITGRRATDKLSTGKTLVQWAKPLLRGKKYPQLVDTKISSSYKQDQLRWLIQVAQQCLKKNPKERSSMNVVVSELQDIDDTDCSPEKSYLPDYAPGMTSSQGQTMDDELRWEQEQIESISYEEERSLRTKTRNNDITDHIKPDEVKENEEDIEGKIMLEDSKTFACFICKTKRPNIRSQTNFTYIELQAATEGFSIKNSLSEDAYGPAFKGKLKCNLKVVVKQLQMTSSHEEKTFKSEVQLLTRATHENVVMLLGSCIQETKLLIVYEKACNGSLDHYLSGGSCRSLTWRERMKIALGVCKGLKYLHENNIIHGSVKPSNILLTHEFEPLVGDFGFGKSRNELKNWHKNKRTMNPGYMAPEFMESGKLSTKTDVYSFGVVLLELITGHRVIDKISGHKTLVEWAKPLLSGRKYPQLVDPKISASCDDQELFPLVQLIDQCLRKNPKNRLTMNMIISALPCIVDNKPFVAKDSPANNSWDVERSQDRAESQAEEDLSRGISGESENDVTCSSSDNRVRQDNTSEVTCGGSHKETLETERLSTKVHQEEEGQTQRCISCGSAKIYFHGGAKEYIVDEQFFSLCMSS